MGQPIRSEVYQGIRSVDAGAWDRITAGHPYAGRAWCQFGEAVHGHEGTYVIIRCGDEPIGGACFFLLHREQLPFKNKTVRTFLERTLEKNPLLVCRTAEGTNHSGLFLPESPELRQPALDLIRAAAIEAMRSRAASFALFDYLEAGEMGMGWDGFSSLNAFLDEGTRLDTPWPTYDEYLAHIKSHSLSRRKWFKRNLKKSLEAGIEVRFDKIPDVDEAVRLHQNVENQYNEVPYPYTREVIAHARDLPNAVFMTAWLDGRMVSSELLMHDTQNRVCTPTLYGRDYDAEAVYFYTYVEVIRHSIEALKVGRIIGNSGAYDFKHHLGFGPDPRNNLKFTSGSAMLRGVSGWLTKLAG